MRSATAALVLLAGCAPEPPPTPNGEEKEAAIPPSQLVWRFDEDRRVATYGSDGEEVVRVACDRVSGAGRPMLYISRAGGRDVPGAATLTILSGKVGGTLTVESADGGAGRPLSWWGHVAPDSSVARALEGEAISLSFGLEDMLALPGGDAPRRAIAACR